MRYGSLVPGAEVIYQHAEVSLIATRRPALFFRREAGGVKSGQQPLSRRLFITGGTVDLAGEEQTLNKFALKRWLQIARVEEIVLNSVAGRTIRAFSIPCIERTICICTSNGRLVDIPFG